MICHRIGALVAVLLSGCGASSAEPEDAGLAETDAGLPSAPWAVALPPPGFVEAVAADGAGRVYVLSGGTLHAFGPDGEPLWERAATAAALGPRHNLAALDEGVVAALESDVVRFAADGEEVWRYPRIGVQAVAAGADEVAVLHGNGLAVVQAADGTERWNVERSLGEVENSRESIVAALPDGGWVSTPPLVAWGATGEPRWERAIPARELHAVAVAEDGTILVTGVYDEFGADFGLGPLPYAINFDPYVALFASDGTPRASIAFTGPDFEYPYGAASDGNRFVVTGHYGEFSNGIDIGDTHLESAGGRDTFLAWLDTEGRIERVSSISADGDVVGRAAAWSPRGRWIVAGLHTPELELSGTVLDAVDAGWGGFLWVGPE